MDTPKLPSFAETLNKLGREGYGVQRTEAALRDAEQRNRDRLRDYKKGILLAFGSPRSGADEKIEEWFKAGVPPQDAIDRLQHGSESTTN